MTARSSVTIKWATIGTILTALVSIAGYPWVRDVNKEIKDLTVKANNCETWRTGHLQWTDEAKSALEHTAAANKAEFTTWRAEASGRFDTFDRKLDAILLAISQRRADDYGMPGPAFACWPWMSE